MSSVSSSSSFIFSSSRPDNPALSGASGSDRGAGGAGGGWVELPPPTGAEVEVKAEAEVGYVDYNSVHVPHVRMTPKEFGGIAKLKTVKPNSKGTPVFEREGLCLSQIPGVCTKLFEGFSVRRKTDSSHRSSSSSSSSFSSSSPGYADLNIETHVQRISDDPTSDLRIGFELTASPMTPERLSRIKHQPAVLLVLDHSGSMSGEPLEQAKKGLIEVLDCCRREKSPVAVMGFSTLAGVISPMRWIDTDEDYQAMIKEIKGMRASGETNSVGVLNTVFCAASGYMDLMRAEYGDAATPLTVVFATDGRPSGSKLTPERLMHLQALRDAAMGQKANDLTISFIGITEDKGIIADMENCAYFFGGFAHHGDHSKIPELLMQQLKRLPECLAVKINRTSELVIGSASTYRFIGASGCMNVPSIVPGGKKLYGVELEPIRGGKGRSFQVRLRPGRDIVPTETSLNLRMEFGVDDLVSGISHHIIKYVDIPIPPGREGSDYFWRMDEVNLYNSKMTRLLTLRPNVGGGEAQLLSEVRGSTASWDMPRHLLNTGIQYFRAGVCDLIDEATAPEGPTGWEARVRSIETKIKMASKLFTPERDRTEEKERKEAIPIEEKEKKEKSSSKLVTTVTTRHREKYTRRANRILLDTVLAGTGGAFRTSDHKLGQIIVEYIPVDLADPNMSRYIAVCSAWQKVQRQISLKHMEADPGSASTSVVNIHKARTFFASVGLDTYATRDGVNAMFVRALENMYKEFKTRNAVQVQLAKRAEVSKQVPHRLNGTVRTSTTFPSMVVVFAGFDSRTPISGVFDFDPKGETLCLNEPLSATRFKHIFRPDERLDLRSLALHERMRKYRDDLLTLRRTMIRLGVYRDPELELELKRETESVSSSSSASGSAVESSKPAAPLGTFAHVDGTFGTFALSYNWDGRPVSIYVTKPYSEKPDDTNIQIDINQPVLPDQPGIHWRDHFPTTTERAKDSWEEVCIPFTCPWEQLGNEMERIHKTMKDKYNEFLTSDSTKYVSGCGTADEVAGVFKERTDLRETGFFHRGMPSSHLDFTDISFSFLDGKGEIHTIRWTLRHIEVSEKVRYTTYFNDCNVFLSLHPDDVGKWDLFFSGTRPYPVNDIIKKMQAFRSKICDQDVMDKLRAVVAAKRAARADAGIEKAGTFTLLARQGYGDKLTRHRENNGGNSDDEGD